MNKRAVANYSTLDNIQYETAFYRMLVISAAEHQIRNISIDEEISINGLKPVWSMGLGIIREIEKINNIDLLYTIVTFIYYNGYSYYGHGGDNPRKANVSSFKYLLIEMSRRGLKLNFSQLGSTKLYKNMG